MSNGTLPIVELTLEEVLHALSPGPQVRLEKIEVLPYINGLPLYRATVWVVSQLREIEDLEVATFHVRATITFNPMDYFVYEVKVEVNDFAPARHRRDLTWTYGFDGDPVAKASREVALAALALVGRRSLARRERRLAR